MYNGDSRRKRKGDCKYIWRHHGWKLSKSNKNRCQDAGSTEGPKDVEPKQPTSRQIIIKMEKIKDKERILKAVREKQRVNYGNTPPMLSADFSAETL